MSLNNNLYISSSDLEPLSEKPTIFVSDLENTSQVQVEHIDFEWSIEQWEHICSTSTSSFQPVRSPLIHSDDCTWFFTLWKTGDYLSLSFSRAKYGCDDDKSLCSASSHFKLIKPDGSVLMQADGTPSCNPSEETARSLLEKVRSTWKDHVYSNWNEPAELCRWPNFLYLRDLFSDRDNYLDQRGTLKFRIEIKVIWFIRESVTKTPEEALKTMLDQDLRELETSRLSDLTNDIAQLFMASHNSDFAINAGHTTLPVHKPIIFARSKPFYQFLMSLLSSSGKHILQNADPILTNSVTLSDTEPEVVKGILEFIYKGTVAGVKDDVNTLSAILKEAEKYGIRGLRRQCFVQMIESLVAGSGADVRDMVKIVEAQGGEDQVDVMEYLCMFLQRKEKLKNSENPGVNGEEELDSSDGGGCSSLTQNGNNNDDVVAKTD